MEGSNLYTVWVLVLKQKLFLQSWAFRVPPPQGVRPTGEPVCRARETRLHDWSHHFAMQRHSRDCRETPNLRDSGETPARQFSPPTEVAMVSETWSGSWRVWWAQPHRGFPSVKRSFSVKGSGLPNPWGFPDRQTASPVGQVDSPHAPYAPLCALIPLTNLCINKTSHVYSYCVWTCQSWLCIKGSAAQRRLCGEEYCYGAL